MPPLIALLDANVLYPSELRNFLMYLAIPGVYRAKWSKNIHEEWMPSLIRNRPDLTRTQLERTRELMDKNAPDALVTGYESLIPSLNLPDENDRHVLAAAIQSKASVIVTNNLKDFPTESLQQFEVEAQFADQFILNLLDLAAEDVYDAAKAHRLGLKNPPKTVAKYLSTLESEGLVRTVAKLRLALL
jgi:predicted nucleic acid-binding protein